MSDSTQQQQPNSSNFPTLCIQNCGFFGNPMFGNMCSKCFKDHEKTKKTAAVEESTDTPTTTATTTSAAAPATAGSAAIAAPTTASPLTEPSTESTSAVATIDANPVALSSTSPESQESVAKKSVSSSSLDSPATPSSADSSTMAPVASGSSQEPSESPKPVQTNKSRCILCKAKISVAKQISNKCRCEYIFCDNHRTPAHHDCTFDHKNMGKSILEKNNPKLADRKGGASFTRID